VIFLLEDISNILREQKLIFTKVTKIWRKGF